MVEDFCIPGYNNLIDGIVFGRKLESRVVRPRNPKDSKTELVYLATFSVPNVCEMVDKIRKDIRSFDNGSVGLRPSIKGELEKFRESELAHILDEDLQLQAFVSGAKGISDFREGNRYFRVSHGVVKDKDIKRYTGEIRELLEAAYSMILDECGTNVWDLYLRLDNHMLPEVCDVIERLRVGKRRGDWFFVSGDAGDLRSVMEHAGLVYEVLDDKRIGLLNDETGSYTAGEEMSLLSGYRSSIRGGGEIPKPLRTIFGKFSEN